jgi:hypothetical protein
MQYQMMYMENSIVTVEWTNQHGCGGNEATDPQQLNCNMVFQYMCDTDNTQEVDLAMQVILRDGGDTNTPDEPNSYTDVSGNNAGRGHHESEAYYFECKTRKRNKGLFHADQNLNGDTAKFTRQNPNGGRSGLECPEERDYYPYFAANPWRDVAYLTDEIVTPDRCTYIAATSQNNNIKYKCTTANPTAVTPSNTIIEATTQASCEAQAGGVWKAFTHGIPAPFCGPTGWSRVNHLGNGREGQALSYNMTLPTMAQLGTYYARYDATTTPTPGGPYAKCVFRIRYNISTDDYDPWNTNSSQDDDPAKGIVSPVKNNPTVDVGADLQGLKLAINTNQFGRTFQDRSHVYYIRSRPAAFATQRIWNLNVRGKRGNIVQTYPSVEYDFIPNRLHIPAAEMASTYLHVQWTGSNTHNNGDPAGDGQAGDAGEGTTGTDRHNFVQMLNKDENYPIPLDKFTTENMFFRSKCYDHAGNPYATWQDCAISAATAGYFRTVGAATDNLNVLLNNAPASFVGGVMMNVQTAGEYNYMCTRNNNFSNRSQKGVMIIGVPATCAGNTAICPV